MRVHELAKEFGIASKDVVQSALDLGMLVKNHMSSLSEEEVAQLRTAMTTKPGELPKDSVPESAPEPVDEAETAIADAAVEAAARAKAEEDADNIGNLKNPPPRKSQQNRPGRRGGRGGASLSKDDPYWQFGTPVEYWGSSRGDAGSGGRDPSGLSADDPYWKFGSPPETWGSSRKKDDKNRQQYQSRPRKYLECRTCGVKIEKKRSHGDKKIGCPFCSRWMKEVQ
jgi:hypothetical protein